MRIRFAGFGGQGIVSCGLNMGKAAMLDGKNAIQTQSYGSASRGGLTYSDVSIEDGEIHELLLEEFDVLVALSQQSCDRFRGKIAPGGTLFYESDLATVEAGAGQRAFGVRATDIAFKQFGRKIMANMIVLGFVNQVLGVVSCDSLASTIRESVPPGTEGKNIEAFEEGMRLGAEAMAGQ